MTKEQAAEILEACQMGREALLNPLKAYLEENVPVWLENIGEHEPTKAMIDNCVKYVMENVPVIIDFPVLYRYLKQVVQAGGNGND